MSDDDKELQDLFDRTAASPTGAQVHAMARKAAQLPAERNGWRKWTRRIALVAFPTASIVAGLFLVESRSTVALAPVPSARTVYVDPEPVGPGPEPTEVAFEDEAALDDLIDDEDFISALEVD